jgi:putative drug exporter of the RND superfamily
VQRSPQLRSATLTLLPLVLAKLDHRINKLALPWSRAGEHRSPRFLPPTAAARIGYDRVQAAFRPGAPGTLQIITPARDSAAA